MQVDEIRALLGKAIDEAGSARKLARKIGVSTTFISLIVNGKKEPSGKVLAFLGVRKVTRSWYERDGGPEA